MLQTLQDNQPIFLSVPAMAWYFLSDVSCFLLFNILAGTVSLRYFCTERFRILSPILGLPSMVTPTLLIGSTFQSALQMNGQKVLPTKIRKTGLFVKTSKTVIFSMVYFVRIKYVKKGSIEALFHTLTVIYY